MSRIITAGATSQSVYVDILDSTSTTGGRKTGLAYNTAGLKAYYALAGASAVAITLATLANSASAYSSGGFIEVDATNMPGIYRLDVPNAALASGPAVVVTLSGATGMVATSLTIQLIAANLQDSVRAGLTALPNAAAEAAGGLYTRGTGAGQINQDANGRVDCNVKTWIGGTIPAVNVTGVPLVDAKYLLGTIFATPATAGIMDVNAKNINNVATTSVTTINANQGTTQPINFTGTGATAYAKADMVDVAGAAVSASTAQLGVNLVNIAGSAVSASTAQLGVNLVNVAGAAVSTSTAQLGVNAVNIGGTAQTTGIDITTIINRLGKTVVSVGTLDAGTVSSITLPAGQRTVVAGQTAILITSGAAQNECQVLSTVNTGTGVCTPANNFANAPGTATYVCFSLPASVALTSSDFASGALASQTVSAVSGAVGSVTGNVGGNVVGSVASLTTNNDKTGYALTSAYDFAKGTVAMTESYAADGATMTPAQAFYQIWSFLAEKNISSTTLTAKKLDGSTTAMTFTLDSATTPATITRAT